MSNKIDPITVATTWHYIQRVCREMRETAERTATNVLVVTLHDMADLGRRRPGYRNSGRVPAQAYFQQLSDQKSG